MRSNFHFLRKCSLVYDEYNHSKTTKFRKLSFLTKSKKTSLHTLRPAENLTAHPPNSLHTLKPCCTLSASLHTLKNHETSLHTLPHHWTPYHVAPSALSSLHPLSHHWTPYAKFIKAHGPPLSAIFHVRIVRKYVLTLRTHPVDSSWANFQIKIIILWFKMWAFSIS